jgi:Cu-Zn family superoxide dismutase
VTHVATIERASLQGRKAILGRAVVVHERGNDPQSPPIGNAGGRIACGVIGAADPAGPQG